MHHGLPDFLHCYYLIDNADVNVIIIFCVVII